MFGENCYSTRDNTSSDEINFAPDLAEDRVAIPGVGSLQTEVTTYLMFLGTYRVFSSDVRTPDRTCFPWLHFEYCAKQILGRCTHKSNFSVGVQAVKHRVLGW